MDCFMFNATFLILNGKVKLLKKKGVIKELNLILGFILWIYHNKSALKACQYFSF